MSAALLAAISASQILHATIAPRPQASRTLPTPNAAAKTFAALCKARQISDSRPDPAWVGASFAHDNCWAPRMPAQLDGRIAKREQIVAAMHEAKIYDTLSDAYQRCISEFVAVHKSQSNDVQKPARWAFLVIENHRIFVSQIDKKRVATQVAVAIDAFNEYGSECPSE